MFTTEDLPRDLLDQELYGRILQDMLSRECGDMNPYWEGMDQKPQRIIDWLGKPYDGVGNAAHPNSRFTSPITQYPHLSTQYGFMSPSTATFVNIVFFLMEFMAFGLVL